VVVLSGCGLLVRSDIRGGGGSCYSALLVFCGMLYVVCGSVWWCC
jgi:hypothetical protein